MVPIQQKVRSVNFPGSEFGENWLRLQPRREVPWLHPLSDMETKAEPVWEPSSTTGPCKLDKRKLREFWLKDKRINFRRAILNPRPKADLTFTFSNKCMRIKKQDILFRQKYYITVMHPYCTHWTPWSLDPMVFLLQECRDETLDSGCSDNIKLLTSTLKKYKPQQWRLCWIKVV